MKLSSIQGGFVLLLLAFFLLVIVAAGVTFWSLETQRQDALLINLAGRQRMLVQQMTREALEIGMGEAGSHTQILEEASQTFEQTLRALRSGGPAPYLPGREVKIPPTRNGRLLNQLTEVDTIWQAFRDDLQTVLTQPPTSPAFQIALGQIESASPELVRKSDAAVRLFEAASTQKVVRLRWIQAIFLASALLLLAGGAWMVRNSILAPLRNLGRMAQHIGSGNLSTPVDIQGPEEIRLLGENLDEMRAQLLASQDEAQAWTDLLERRVAHRTQELEALYSVSREISSRLAINDVLHSITGKTQELLGCDVVFLCLLDDSGQRMVLHAASGPEESIEQSSSPVYTATVGKVLAGERALRCDDQGCRGYCEILASPYRASHVAAPLKVERQIIGALCVGSAQPGKFGEDSIDALTKLANVAAVALQNARLYDQAERLATSEERQRIAAEMHDGLAQTLSYTKLAVSQASMQIAAEQVDEAVNTLERVNAALDQANEDTRRAIASLQEQGPLNETLQEQLARLAEEFSRDSPVVEWFSSVLSPVMLARQESQQVLRVVQEALLNARHHSQATRISIRLEKVGGENLLIVEDDGKGFNPDSPPDGDGRHHFGLNIMRARAARIAGRVDIQSAPGAGTRVLLYWPSRVEAT